MAGRRRVAALLMDRWMQEEENRKKAEELNRKRWAPWAFEVPVQVEEAIDLFH